MSAETVHKNTTFGSGLIYLVDSFDVAQLDTEITSKLIDTNLLLLTDDGLILRKKRDFSTQLAGFNEKRVKGYETVVRAEGKISGTGRLANSKLLEASLYKKQENSSTKYDVYKVEEGVINSYKDVVMVATNKATEKAQIIILHNAYNSNLSLETKGSDDGSCKLEFASAYDKENLNKVPYEICTLKES